MKSNITIVKQWQYYIDLSSFINNIVLLTLQIKCEDNVNVGNANVYFFYV